MNNNILVHVVKKTRLFLESIPKSERKKKGQFFTSMETAKFMAGMFDFSLLKKNVSILDPGTGSGILSAAIVDRLNELGVAETIHLTCYETDSEIQPLLLENLALIRQMSNIPLQYELIPDNYILSQQHDFEEALFINPDSRKYDLVIANPPYLRIMRDDANAIAMPTIVHGAPNLYFLFAAMSLFNLKQGAEMVYIIPRSWTSGLYFLHFRKYLLTHGKLMHIHLFVSRDKVFKDEEVLQETIIVKVKKTSEPPMSALVTSSKNNNDFNHITSFNVPYSSIVTGKDFYVFCRLTAKKWKSFKKSTLMIKHFLRKGCE